MIDTERLHLLYTLLHCTRIYSCPKSTKNMVVGISLEKNLLTVKPKSEVRTNFHSSYSECLGYLVGNTSVFPEKLNLCRLEVRMLAIPELRIIYRYRRNL